MCEISDGERRVGAGEYQGMLTLAGDADVDVDDDDAVATDAKLTD